MFDTDSSYIMNYGGNYNKGLSPFDNIKDFYSNHSLFPKFSTQFVYNLALKSDRIMKMDVEKQKVP